ncbi:MAG: MATE family efflux transporter [Tissierellia bacterium]|nr:MATE family efflux transporter [Tissierellia bacterium]
MKKELNLLSGDITPIIVKMSMPLMGTAFVQMCYSLVDLMWLGRLSTGAVAAVGTCSFFVWIAQAITLVAKTGLSVGLSQSYGRQNSEEAKKVMVSGFWLNLFFCLLVTGIFLIFKKNIIGFYQLEPEVEKMTITYFTIVSIGLIFTYLNPMFATTFFSKGNSVTPFNISIIALIFNIIMDPILIFGWKKIPAFGIGGAAYATVLAQALATLLYLYIGKKSREIFWRVNYFKLPSKEYFMDILYLGVPASLQSTVHAFVGIILNRFIASFGAVAIAVYSIGSQIESISWMSADGFATAFSAFFGQNYGARQFDRLQRGRRSGMWIVSAVGIFAFVLLFLGSKFLFTLFIPHDPEAIELGVLYLQIVAPSQYFMAIEIGTTGMLNGLGLTKYPALNAVILNIIRIPLAPLLISLWGVNGIWAAMSISSILKGIILNWIYYHLRRKTDGFKNDMNRYVSGMRKLKMGN